MTVRGEGALPEESSARGTLFLASRAAVTDLWGQEGLRQVSERLSGEARTATLGTAIITTTSWVPERHMMAWYDAVWGGPAARQSAEFRRFINRRMDHGFGRVRKLLLSVATPRMLAEKAPGLWRHDHSQGELRTVVEPSRVYCTLEDHLYTTTATARLAVAEVYRYALQLTRAKNVVETHVLDETGALQVRVEWDARS